jgi:nucleotide-binding universal stress UspA family protein
MQAKALEQLKALVPENSGGDAEINTVVLCDSSPSKAIACLAREEHADLIVVGTHGRSGLTRLLMGSTAESLLRYSPCQVLVVKRRGGANTKAA